MSLFIPFFFCVLFASLSLNFFQLDYNVMHSLFYNVIYRQFFLLIAKMVSLQTFIIFGGKASGSFVF